MKHILSKQIFGMGLRYLCAIVALLFIVGIGKVRAYTLNYPFIYFNNSQGWNQVMFLYGHNSSSKADNMTQISNTNLWFVKCSENWGTELSNLGFGFANTNNWGYESSIGFTTRWGYLDNQSIAHTGYIKDNSNAELDYNTYYFTSSGSNNLVVSKKADNGNWCENTLPEYSAYLKIKKSEDGGSTYPTTISSGTWPGSFTLQGTKIKRNGDKDSNATPYGSRTGSEAASATTSGAQATYDNVIITGLVTMTHNATTDDAYEFTGWGTGDSPIATESSYEYNMPANDQTYYAFFKRKQFTITFEPKGTYGTSSVAATISSTPLTSGNSYNYGSNITFTATPATGYKIEGWYSDASCETSLENGTNLTYSVNNLTEAKSVYVKFAPKQAAITFSQSGEGYASGTPAGNTATFGANMISITPPIANTGYTFQGYFDGEHGTGTQYYKSDGTSKRTWNKDTEDGVTLYAYFHKAEITSLSFNPITTGTHQKVVVTPTVAPTPEGTVYTCWKLFYDNECTRELDTVTFHSNPSTGVNDVYFYTPGATGAYYIRAILRTSNSCESAGLDTIVRQYAVASEHTVTIQYKCGEISIHTPSTVTIEAGGTKGVNAYTGDDVFGYQFTNWTISDDSGVTTENALTNSEITISAIMNGTIIANYSKKNIIYFKDNLGWTNPEDEDAHIYVHLKSASEWNSERGTGNKYNYYSRNNQMSRVPNSLDIFYYEYGGGSISKYISFTQYSYDDYESFEGTIENPAEVVYVTNPYTKSSDDLANYGFDARTPLFVPLDKSTYGGQLWNNSKAKYFNRGYWVNYVGDSTGYVLEVYNSDGSTLRQSKPFSSADGFMSMSTSVDLEAGKTYKLCLKRGSISYGNTGTMTFNDCGVTTGWEFKPDVQKCGITTTAAGNYTFLLTYSANGEGIHAIRIGVIYPAAVGDYRMAYTDNATWTQENGTHSASWIHPSRTITKRDDRRDTVSFYINKDANPQIKIQSISGVNPVSWANVTEFVNIPDTIKSKGTGVYNFILKQEGGSISIEKIEPYIGNYYIRVDCAGSTKWSDYKVADHMVTYSDYAANKTGSDYTHYYMKFVKANDAYKNVKFVIANDYSPCISDTLVQQTSDVSVSPSYTHVNASGVLQHNANIRFMWDSRTNRLKRAYLAEGQSSGSHFLVLQGQYNNIFYKEGNNVRLVSANNNGVENDAIQFTDNQNWVYEATVKAKPGGRVKLYARYGDDPNYTYHYFYGDNDASFEDSHAVVLISGSGDPELIRAIYDFKTDRLLAAWIPSGTIGNGETKEINADIMLVRKHQESGQQVNLLGTGKITTNKKVYAVMQFNKYELNNLEKTGSHNPLSPGNQKSSFERHNYFISFPFDVKLGEIFGFGQVGVHWRIMYYDGLGRAQEGFFAERTTNWFMIDDTDSILHANQGYMLQLSPSAVSASNGTTWANNLEQIELYFPSLNSISSIELENETIPALGEEYKCTKDLSSLYDGNQEANRTIKDSYWRCIGVPGFTSYEANADTWTNFDWRTDGLPYIYEWVKTDNSLRVISSNTFTFQPMHAYLVQNKNAIIWTSVAKPVAAIVARKGLGTNETYEFRLEISQSTTLHDQTYIRLTNQDGVTANFDFGQDLSKELNSGKNNIYTFIGYEKAAANSLSLSNQTTQVAVGVQIAEDGNYTFAIPDGTNGIGVTLIDNETGTRTNLSAIDYNVNLSAGTYDNRFTLEISAVDQTPTNIEESTSEEAKTAGARKLLIDGVLYIVRDGKIYDARGVRIE